MASPTNLGAIITAFNNSPAFADAAASQGAWMGAIPDQFSDQNLPFVVLIHHGDINEYNFEGAYLEHCKFEWNVYGSPLKAAEATAAKIKPVFDKPGTNDANPAFQINNARVLRCWRPEGEIGYKVEPVGQRLSTGELVYLVRLFYTMVVEKSL